jgi:hypothetical protein
VREVTGITLADARETDIEKWPQELRRAITVFTRDELRLLVAAFDEQGHFAGIGIPGQDNTFTKFANTEKADAIQIMERHYLANAIEDDTG